MDQSHQHQQQQRDQQHQQQREQQANNDRDQHHNQSPQSLSYHQQQLLHLLHLQRVGGLNKLTADLAGVQFQELEGGAGAGTPQATNTNVVAGQRAGGSPTLALNLPQALRAGGTGAGHQAVRPPARIERQQQQAVAATTAAAVAAAAALQKQRRQQLEREREREQLEKQDSATGSESSEQRLDPVRDAQETAEDAASLKRYKFLQLIGTGNYARVYRATNPNHNNREVAVKSINLARTTDNYKQKFLPRELSILKRINHPNICKIYEITQVSDRIFIVMQYCSRGTIADLLQRNQGPFNEGQSRHLFVPTVDALAYLHGCDIAHRDVKIENILLDHDYIPKLTDFSFSCLMTEKTSHHNAHNKNQNEQQLLQAQTRDKSIQKTSGGTGQQTSTQKNQNTAGATKTNRKIMRLNETFCGTLPYLSPEMIRQFPYDPRKTDVWSLGVCLYVMLNDRLPFPFNDIKMMVRRQLTREFKFRSNVDVSEPCKELVGLMLEPNFSKRSTALELGKHSWMSGPRERPGR